MTKDVRGNSYKLYLSTKSCVYDLQSVKSQLGDATVSALFVLYAFTGCDTTSRIHGVGQDKLLKIRHKLDESVVSPFYNANATKDEIKQTGESIFIQLLGLSPNESSLDAA